MPAFNVTIDSQTYHVDIPNPGANPLRVVVDGQAFDIDVAGVTPGQPVAPAAIRPATTAAPAPRPAVAVTAPAPVEAKGTGSVGGSLVSAPMPGTILSLEVCAGQPVEAGQVVCLLEAMKMKNPVRTSRAGTVAEVCVSAGQTVSYGEPLVRMV